MIKKDQIIFNNIHSKNKQTYLERKMQKVNDEIKKIRNENKKRKSCIVCKSKNLNFFTVKYQHNLDRCENCGHIFTNPYPSAKQISYYYNSSMKKFENNFFKETFNARTKIFIPRANLIKKLLNDKGSLLDIGAGVGIFMNAFKKIKSNISLTACDINKEAISLIKSKFPKIKTINCDFLDLDESKKYDCITLWDTFEHLIDPSQFLLKIRKIIKKNGYLILSTPNTLSLEWALAKNEHVQILPPGHVNLYNRSNIKIIFNKNFKIENIFTLNGSLDVSYIEKFVKNKKDISSVFWKNFINNKKTSTFLANEISNNCLAGNMMVIVKRI